MNNNSDPLSIRSILAGILVTVVGGVIVAFITGQGRFLQLPSFSGFISTSDAPSASDSTIHGQISWNDQPIAGLTVILHPEQCWLGKTQITQTTTDSTGHYEFQNPFQSGIYTYSLETRGNGDEYGVYGDFCQSASIDSRDPSTLEQNFNLIKYDLIITNPVEGTKITDTPCVIWKAYQNATEYKVILRQVDTPNAIWSDSTPMSTICPAVMLQPGDYSFQVDAYNLKGTRIAYRYASFTVVH